MAKQTRWDIDNDPFHFIDVLGDYDRAREETVSDQSERTIDDDPFHFVDEVDDYESDIESFFPDDADIFYFTLEYTQRANIEDPAPDSFEECLRRVEAASNETPVHDQVLLAIAVAVYGNLDHAFARKDAKCNPFLMRALDLFALDPMIGRTADSRLESAVRDSAHHLNNPSGLIQRLFAAIHEYTYLRARAPYVADGMGMGRSDIMENRRYATEIATGAIIYAFGDDGLLEILANENIRRVMGIRRVAKSAWDGDCRVSRYGL